MKKRPLLFLSLTFAVISLAFVGSSDQQFISLDSFNAISGFEGAAEHYRQLRANPETGVIDKEVYNSIRESESALRAEKSSSSLGLEWEEVGPDNIGSRTKAILSVSADLLFTGSESGGLFKSTNSGDTWERVSSFNDSYAITSMAVLGNGHIYVGTGSSIRGDAGLGNGLYVSTDDGGTWNHADDSGSPIKPGTIGTGSYSIIDDIKADPSQDNKLWVGSDQGLQAYVEGSGFVDAANGLPADTCNSIDVSGNVVAGAFMNNGVSFYLSTDGGDNFEDRSGFGNDEIPTDLVARLLVAISPDNDDFIYATGVDINDGSFGGVWGSNDKGASFEYIWAGDVVEINPDDSFFPVASYALAIKVVPGEPGLILVGALDVWLGGFAAQPEQRSASTLFGFQGFGALPFVTFYPTSLDEEGDPNLGGTSFVHADINTFEFDENGTLFVGNNGGVSRSLDGAISFTHCNRFYNSVQYFSIGISADDQVIGGANYNGTTLITGAQSTTEEAITVNFGSGFDCDISNLDPATTVLFSSFNNNFVWRTNDGGNTVSNPIMSPEMQGLTAPFASQMSLWENGNSVTPYLVDFKNDFDEIIPAGTEVLVDSRVEGFTFTQTLPNDLLAFESVDFMDPATSLLSIGYGNSGGVWVTREGNYFDTQPTFAKVVAGTTGLVSTMEWSKGDGNDLWVGTYEGFVYRISGFADAWTNEEMSVDSAQYELTVVEIAIGSNVITDISVDPNDDDHVVISQGGFGGDSKILEATNGTGATPSFSDIWFPAGDPLAGMPVYSCLIEASDANIIIAGTEFGVYATDNGGSEWSAENSGPMSSVIVYDIEQQWRDPAAVSNAGYIYLGTFGRGAMRSTTYEKNLIETSEGLSNQDLVGDMVVRPNPMSQDGWIDFTSYEDAQIDFELYSINGQKVKSVQFGVTEGANHFKFDVSDLSEGTYIIQLKKDNKVSTDKFIIIR